MAASMGTVQEEKDDNAVFQFIPIGILRSVFLHKNGTPRQPTVCSSSRASLTIRKSVFNNPEHSLDGLLEYSHAWIIFLFHLNKNECSKAKVKVPRLNGRKLGLFATRCPYRPVPVGLTLAKVEGIQNDTVHFSGIDIIDGTPILDIKPYIPEYDQPSRTPSQSILGDSTSDMIADSPSSIPAGNTQANLAGDTLCGKGSNSDAVQSADWLDKCRKKSSVCDVEFTRRALRELDKFQPGLESDYRLMYLQSNCDAKQAIVEILLGDPRSAYRRQSCTDKLYYFTVDTIHVTCWFDDTIAEVLKVQPISRVEALKIVPNDTK